MIRQSILIACLAFSAPVTQAQTTANIPLMTRLVKLYLDDNDRVYPSGHGGYTIQPAGTNANQTWQIRLSPYYSSNVKVFLCPADPTGFSNLQGWNTDTTFRSTYMANYQFNKDTGWNLSSRTREQQVVKPAGTVYLADGGATAISYTTGTYPANDYFSNGSRICYASPYAYKKR